MASYERRSLLRTVGLICALLALLIAVLVVERNYRHRQTLAFEVRQEKQLRMRSVVEHVEDHMRGIWLCLKLISLDPKIATLSPGPYEHIEAVHEATFSFHGLTEIYVTERDFDGKRHPFMSLFREDPGHLIEARHPLEREQHEYAVHVEQIRRFADDPSLAFLISKPVPLCVGRPGVVCSVPIRSAGHFAGIVAGMVRSKEISDMLEITGAGDEVLLANDTGGVFANHDLNEETRAWFQERFDKQGVQGFFEQTEPSFRVGQRRAFWEAVRIPAQKNWYIAYCYDENDYLKGSAIQSSWTAWTSGGAVVLLGLLAMFLCRLVPALAATRAQADARADQLAESDARTRAILDTAADGIVTIDERGVIESFNTAAERIFGYNGDEVVGKYVNMLMPPPHEERHGDYLERYLRSGERRLIDVGRELEGLHKDGRTFPIELGVSEVRLGDRRLFTGLVRDVTERKRSEEALRQSEERYRTLVQNIDLGVSLIDADHNIVMVNAAQGRMFDKPVLEFVGKKCYQEFESRDAACSHCPGVQAMATGEPAECETEGVRNDGSRFTARLRAFPITRPNGEAKGFIEVMEDITSRKQSEKQARERQAELAHVARLGTIGEMAAGLSHELNQPLSAIVNYLQACTESIGAGMTDVDTLLGDMEQASGQAVRAGEIIERLRNFSGNPTSHRGTIHMNKLVREVVAMTESEIRQCGIEIELELDDSLPSLRGDGIQIEQVLVNLIKNGMEAMANDRTATRRLTILTSKNDEDQVVCTVLDTGPGVSEETAARLFEAFYSTKSSGMGVGLSLSRKIIEAHGGRLWMMPKRDRGAAFRFVLPIIAGDPNHES